MQQTDIGISASSRYGSNPRRRACHPRRSFAPSWWRNQPSRPPWLPLPGWDSGIWDGVGCNPPPLSWHTCTGGIRWSHTVPCPGSPFPLYRPASNGRCRTNDGSAGPPAFWLPDGETLRATRTAFPAGCVPDPPQARQTRVLQNPYRQNAHRPAPRTAARRTALATTGN